MTTLRIWNSLFRPVFLGLVIAALASSSRAQTLYATDFSDFPAGDDQLVGLNGWTANTLAPGISGVAADLIQGYGNSAWFGIGNPGTNFVQLYREFGGESAPNARGRFEFDATVGIEPSSNGNNDSFSVAFYNAAGERLSLVRFNTANLDFGIWSNDAGGEVFTGAYFQLEQIYRLKVKIDPAANLWSLYLTDIPVFENRIFASLSNGASRVPVAFAFEWNLAGSLPGDNWMFIDALATIRAQVEITSVTLLGDGSRQVNWNVAGEGGCLVQASEDLNRWTTLGTVAPSTGQATASYVERSARASGRRFYRVLQTIQ